MENSVKAASTDALKPAQVSFGNSFGLALYDKEQRNVARPGARQQLKHEQAIDTGFDQPAPSRPSISQRALATTRRPNGKMTDVSDLPV